MVGVEIVRYLHDISKRDYVPRTKRSNNYYIQLERKLQKVYETLPEPTGLPEDANSYDKAVAKLDRYFAGKVNQPYERHKFRAMRQEPSESVAHFVSRLKGQADFCGFDDTRDIQVRDQLIEGCLANRLRLKLLEKGNNLSLDVALELSSCYESVHQQASEMQHEMVNKIDMKTYDKRTKMADRARGQAQHRVPNNQTKPDKWKRNCWKCGREGHLSFDDCCPAKNVRCGNLWFCRALCECLQKQKKYPAKSIQYQPIKCKQRRVEFRG